LSSLNISGRTIIGNDNYNYSDSSFEVNKNIMIRNSSTSGSRIDLQVGLGTGRHYLSVEQGYDINLVAPSGGTRMTTIALSSDQIRLNAPKSYTYNLVVTGSIDGDSGLNIGFTTPISFTTNRNINIMEQHFHVMILI
jgi:hypothetical protein